MLIIGVESGGPPVMVWGWIGVCALSLAVAYSMAEMCSAYPIVGGQYSWVAILAPPKWARGLSYICGWFMLTGLSPRPQYGARVVAAETTDGAGFLAMGATNNFITANFVLGMANLANPNYIIERWHTVLVAYLITLVAAGLNIYGGHLLDRLSKAVLIWNIASFVVVVVTILATNDHKQLASFVFYEFQNFTGFGTGMAAILGIVQSAFGMCCYNAPSHMTEEMNNASKEAPKAIVLAVWLGAVTGFVFLIAACFCIGDVEATATFTTGVPIIQIFYDSTGSVAGSCALATLLTVICVVCSNALTAEGSRAIYAFARDRGLPLSDLFSKVEPRTQVPVYGVLLTAVVQAALDSMYFGTITGFQTVITISTAGFCKSTSMLQCRCVLTMSWTCLMPCLSVPASSPGFTGKRASLTDRTRSGDTGFRST